jgi:hypothetical protein
MATMLLRLSYRQLAEHLDITTEAARPLARRRHWQRVVGNDGVAMVIGDEAELARRPGGQPGGRPPGRPDHPTVPMAAMSPSCGSASPSWKGSATTWLAS